MNPLSKIHSSWIPIMEILNKDEKLRELNTKILPNQTFYPEAENIFNVFSMPVQDIKVVILGQDPYPRKGQAIGYSFAVSEETNIPASLRIIKQEIINNGVAGDMISTQHTDIKWKSLEHWREQGIFLLNTALTVEEGKAGSHLKYWNDFIIEVIKFISQKDKVVWLLWGKKAQAYKEFIAENNIVLEAPHPAAETYSGGTAGFYGCKHFSKVNEILDEKINW